MNDNTTTADSGTTTDSLFTPDVATLAQKEADTAAAAAAAGKEAKTEPPARDPNKPDWLLDKFATAEDQAKSYNDLYKAYSAKTENLKAEIQADLAKANNVPEAESEYEYAPDIEKPSDNADAVFRAWAKKNNISKEAFSELTGGIGAAQKAVQDVELGKLGPEAKSRIDDVNRWLSANVEEAFFPEVSKMMQTARGVELVEHLMGAKQSAGFAPDGGSQSTPLTRDSIRNAQADPRFGTDAAYTASVRAMWNQYAKIPEGKRM
jgi:molecular chaperone GrpE (heat shock protein)